MPADLGLEHKLYRWDGTAFVEMTNVRDQSFPMTKTLADSSKRGNKGWKTQRAALKDARLEWQMVYEKDDADFEAIRDAFLTDTPVKMRDLDGEDGDGIEADFDIAEFRKNAALEDVVLYDVVAVPSTAPLRVTDGVTETDPEPDPEP